MGFALRRWRLRHRVLARVADWIGALIVAVGRALASICRATRDRDMDGSMSAAVGDRMFTLTVPEQAGTVWQTSASGGGALSASAALT